VPVATAVLFRAPEERSPVTCPETLALNALRNRLSNGRRPGSGLLEMVGC